MNVDKINIINKYQNDPLFNKMVDNCTLLVIEGIVSKEEMITMLEEVKIILPIVLEEQQQFVGLVEH